MVAADRVPPQPVLERVGLPVHQAARPGEDHRHGLVVMPSRLADRELELDGLVLVVGEAEPRRHRGWIHRRLEEHELDAVLRAVAAPAAPDEEVPADLAARLGQVIARELEVRGHRDHVVAHRRRRTEEPGLDRVRLVGRQLVALSHEPLVDLPVVGRVRDGWSIRYRRNRCIRSPWARGLFFGPASAAAAFGGTPAGSSVSIHSAPAMSVSVPTSSAASAAARSEVPGRSVIASFPSAPARTRRCILRGVLQRVVSLSAGRFEVIAAL